VGWWRDFFLGRQEPTEVRTVDTVPWNAGGYGLGASTALSQDRALTLAPVFAAVRILAGTVSTLPLKPYRRVGEDRIPMQSLPQLFGQLSDAGELVPWLHRCVASLALRGNAYGLITARDGFGFPTRIDWLNPSDVDVDDYRSTIRPVWYWKGREVPQEDIVHIPWFPVAGRVQGLSPIAAFAMTIGVGINNREYGSTWFANGGFPPGTFKNTQRELTSEQSDAIKARLRGAILTRSPLVYGSDWDYNAISVPPNEAQFVEAARMNANDIAAIYGLPPEDIGGSRGGSLTYSTVELNQLDRTLALRPWLVALEHKFGALLPERQYVRFNADAIVRTDLKTRWEVNQIRVQMGVANKDEIRAQEDLPPLPNGQGQAYGPPPAPAPAPQLPPAPEQPPSARASERWVRPA